MVAITVILATVIASFVLGLDVAAQQTPQTQFNFEYTDTDSDDEGVLEIIQHGGETIEGSAVEIRGSSGTNGDDSPVPIEEPSLSGSLSAGHSLPVTWSDESTTAVSSGDTLAIHVGSDYDITVTYVPSEGGSTTPLASNEGPEA